MGATMKKSTTTAENYIKELKKEYKKIVKLENALKEARAKIEKTAAKLRTYKKRGIVKQISKYNYILTEEAQQ